VRVGDGASEAEKVGWSERSRASSRHDAILALGGTGPGCRLPGWRDWAARLEPFPVAVSVRAVQRSSGGGAAQPSRPPASTRCRLAAASESSPAVGSGVGADGLGCRCPPGANRRILARRAITPYTAPVSQ
jgi:hypothetical protein